MPRDLTSLAARYAGRPLLLTPRAAQELADRVRAVDSGAVVREGRFSALIRKLSGNARQPMAMDDDEDYEAPTFEERAVYAPRYIGEPDDYGYCYSLKDGVALMNVDKPLLDRGEFFCGEAHHGYDTLLAALRETAADDRVRAVFIREATPGGVVAGGLPALAQWMRENGARAGGKPIHVYADMACSAGYWIAASADRIVAPRVGLVGSIGAVIVHENYSEALKKFGIEITPIQFGAKKTDGAWWGALSDSAREDLQAEIDQCGRDFVADVIAGRPQLTADAVLATEARVFMGHHDDAGRSALDLNLVDGHASEEEAFAALRDQVASTPRQSTPAAPAASVSEEPDMKRADVLTAARKAGLPQAQIRKLEAQLPKVDAEAAEDDAPESEGDDAPPADDKPEGDDDTPEAGEDDSADGKTEAQKIAASPEAEANPAAATAAIRDGLTLAQFQGQVKAVGKSGPGRLASTLGGSPRLGADGKPQKSAGGIDGKAIYARRAERRRGK